MVGLLQPQYGSIEVSSMAGETHGGGKQQTCLHLTVACPSPAQRVRRTPRGKGYADVRSAPTRRHAMRGFYAGLEAAGAAQASPVISWNRALSASSSSTCDAS